VFRARTELWWEKPAGEGMSGKVQLKMGLREGDEQRV
jgi:hypothetical protein